MVDHVLKYLQIWNLVAIFRVYLDVQQKISKDTFVDDVQPINTLKIDVYLQYLLSIGVHEGINGRSKLFSTSKVGKDAIYCYQH